MRKILVALDASEDRYKVANMVKQLVRDSQEETVVTLFHVAAPVPDLVRYRIRQLERDAGLDIDVDTLADRSAQAVLKPIESMLKDAGIRVEIDTVVGEAGREICLYADRGGYDLIVMGRRDLNRLQKALLGSVTEYVLRYARTPVLIVQYADDAKEVARAS